MTTSMIGRVAVVTGVSRRAGIGFAIARDLLASGMTVLIQSWTAHDAEQPWGRDPVGMPGVIEALRKFGGRLEHIEVDFALPDAPAAVVGTAVTALWARRCDRGQPCHELGKADASRCHGRGVGPQLGSQRPRQRVADTGVCSPT
jgi:NAD(P)-dependent dehydrogenase (short-subunit alcohol dehydrogenase family)